MAHNSSRKTPVWLPLIVMALGIFLIASALIGGLTQNSPPATSSPLPHDEESYPEIERVSLEDAQNALTTGTAVFLDVRDSDSFTAGHISGAVNIPLAELNNRMGELDPSDWIITYCT